MTLCDEIISKLWHCCQKNPKPAVSVLHKFIGIFLTSGDRRNALDNIKKIGIITVALTLTWIFRCSLKLLKYANTS